MLAATTKLKNAQKVKEYLVKHNFINQDFLPVKELGMIYFPVISAIKKTKVPLAKVVDTRFKFSEKQKEPSVEELLENKLTKKEFESLPKSQEVIGKILILEIPEELEKKEQLIAEAYLKAHKHIETVVKKEEFHSGVFRTRKVRVLAGKNNKETIHQENGVQLKINIEEVYFSARLATERLRIARQVKNGEDVLVMFSGAAPYLMVIARNSPAAKVYGIEINPTAHQLALQNIELNSMRDKAIVYEGDVRMVLPKIAKKFDRVVMPLPKTGEQFMDLALAKIKKEGIIHYYAFLAEEEIPAEKKKIKLLCGRFRHKIKILRAVKCGQFSPKVFRVCFDVKVE